MNASSDCAEDNDTNCPVSGGTATITQGNDGSATVTVEGTTRTGSFNGTTLTGTGTFEEDGGTTTYNVSLTLSSDGNTLTGQDSWSWTDGFYNCTGTTSITAMRQQTVQAGGATVVFSHPADARGVLVIETGQTCLDSSQPYVLRPGGAVEITREEALSASVRWEPEPR